MSTVTEYVAKHGPSCPNFACQHEHCAEVRRLARLQSPQRQDSLTEQMRSVKAYAVSLGCYDAADWIERAFFERERRAAGLPLDPHTPFSVMTWPG